MFDPLGRKSATLPYPTLHYRRYPTVGLTLQPCGLCTVVAVSSCSVSIYGRVELWRVQWWLCRIVLCPVVVLSNYGVSSSGVLNCAVSNYGMSDFVVSSCGVSSYAVSSREVPSCSVSKCFVSNCNVSSCCVLNCGGVELWHIELCVCRNGPCRVVCVELWRCRVVTCRNEGLPCQRALGMFVQRKYERDNATQAYLQRKKCISLSVHKTLFTNTNSTFN